VNPTGTRSAPPTSLRYDRGSTKIRIGLRGDEACSGSLQRYPSQVRWNIPSSSRREQWISDDILP